MCKHETIEGSLILCTFKRTTESVPPDLVAIPAMAFVQIYKARHGVLIVGQASNPTREWLVTLRTVILLPF